MARSIYRTLVAACGTFFLAAGCDAGKSVAAPEPSGSQPSELAFPRPAVPAAIGRMVENLKGIRADFIIYVSPDWQGNADGSRKRPFNKINDAIVHAKPCTAIMVMAGNYNEHVQFPRSINGAPDCPIWLVSADGPGKAKIVAPNDNLPAIGGGGNENIVVEGFATEGGRNGIHFGMNGADFTDLARNIVLRFNTVKSPTMDAIKINGAETVLISDNILERAPNEGIDFVAVIQSAITHNTIIDMNTSSAAIVIKGGSSNILINNNMISNISSNGISVGGWASREMPYRTGFGSSEAERVVVSGNKLDGIGKSPLVFMGAHDCKAYNNLLAGGTTFPSVWIGGNRPDAVKKFNSERLHVSDNRIIGSRRPLEVKPNSSAIEFIRNDRDLWSGDTGADLTRFSLLQASSTSRR